jgi:hypothetical protein
LILSCVVSSPAGETRLACTIHEAPHREAKPETARLAYHPVTLRVPPRHASRGTPSRFAWHPAGRALKARFKKPCSPPLTRRGAGAAGGAVWCAVARIGSPS